VGYAALGPQHVAWFRYDGYPATASVVEVTRPTSAGDALTESVRTFPAPDCVPTCVLAALGDDDVLVGRQLEWFQYYQGATAPVTRVAADGSVSTELSWGHGIAPLAAGGYLAVVGTAPGSAAVQRVPAGGLPGSAAVVLAPVPERVGAVALDGVRLVLTSDTAQPGAVRQRVLDTSGLGTLVPGPVEDVGAGVGVATAGCWPALQPCGGLAADSGATAWNDGMTLRVRDAAGGVSSFPAHRVYGADAARRLSGSAVLAAAGADEQGGALYDATTGSQTMGWQSPDGANPLELDAGVVYWRNPFVPNMVAMRELSSGATASVPVPSPCEYVDAVQTAGPWLLASCGGEQLLLDRRTGTTSDLGTGRLWLGNGFVVRPQAGALSWLDAEDPARTWQLLEGATVREEPQLATSRTASPLVAWVDPQGQAHAALLPVTTSDPVTTAWGAAAAPGAPAPSVSGVTGSSVQIAWPAADPADQVQQYTVTRQPGAVSTVLPGSATSATLTGLTAGTTYTVTVAAQNLAGSAQGTVLATPKHDTPVWPSNVQATVDKVTSRVTVTWSLVPDPQFSDPLHFRVVAGSAVLDGIPVTARSASLVVHSPGEGQVLVYSVGAKAEWPGATSSSFVFPGDDTQAPTMRTPSVPTVLTTTSTTLRFSATDDRRVRDYQVAIRGAGTGQALGSWSYPSTWAHLTTGSLALSRLSTGSTHCYVVRARDDAGNVSRWSPQVCVTVALDDRSWSRTTSGWATSTSSAYYLGSASATSRSSQVLRRTGTRTDAMTLVVTRCPTCGSVGVYDDGVLVAKVSLYASTTVRRALVAVPLGGRRAGTLTIKTLSTGKPVVIDGVALRSY
jgi:hypothetical protein